MSRRLAILACAALALAAAPAHAADYALLNCGAASSVSEKTICKNYGLGQQEARMATLYQWATSFVAMGERGDIQDAQRAFLKERNACGANVACLRRVYDKRINALQAVMTRVMEKGPF